MDARRKALILGGHGDIGNAITNELASQGSEAIAVGRQEMDLERRASIDAYLERKGIEYDIVVHCAGWNKPCLFSESVFSDIEKTIDINLNGFLYLIHRVVPYLVTAKAPRIVIISSLYGFLSRKGRLPYVVSKHGLIGAMKTLAIELGQRGVLVNAVSPGYIETKMTTANNTEDSIKQMEAGIPLSRLGRPEEIAKAVGFLASEDNTYINGHDLVVDGGYSVGGFL